MIAGGKIKFCHDGPGNHWRIESKPAPAQNENGTEVLDPTCRGHQATFAECELGGIPADANNIHANNIH